MPICQNFDTGEKALLEYMAMREAYLRQKEAAETNPKLTSEKGDDRSIWIPARMGEIQHVGGGVITPRLKLANGQPDAPRLEASTVDLL